MRGNHILAVAAVLGLLCLCAPVSAQEPVKWSAPMHLYPNPWTPTAPPPSFYNPYGYRYPYAAYGYGAYGYNPGYYQGYSPGQYGGAYQGRQPGQYQGGQSGAANQHYNYYYGR